MNQAGNLTASSGLFQMEVCKVQGEENGIGNLLCHLLLTQSQPRCHLWATAQPLEEEGREGYIKQTLPSATPCPRLQRCIIFDA